MDLLSIHLLSAFRRYYQAQQPSPIILPYREGDEQCCRAQKESHFCDFSGTVATDFHADLQTHTIDAATVMSEAEELFSDIWPLQLQ